MSLIEHELTGETRIVHGVTLHRIRAGRDLPRHGVRAGDRGGWVQSLGQVCGDAWVCGDARVGGDAWVCGDARVYGDAWVCGDARVGGDAWVGGDARVCGDAWVCGDARVYGDAWVCGDARVYGDAKVCGDARVYGDAKVCGDARVCGDAKVCGDAWVYEPRHMLTAGPVGSEHQTVTIVRTQAGHLVIAGCWSGSLGDLAARITTPGDVWPDAGDDDRERHRADYQAVIDFFAVRAAEWDAERESAC